MDSLDLCIWELLKVVLWNQFFFNFEFICEFENICKWKILNAKQMATMNVFRAIIDRIFSSTQSKTLKQNIPVMWK